MKNPNKEIARLEKKIAQLKKTAEKAGQRNLKKLKKVSTAFARKNGFKSIEDIVAALHGRGVTNLPSVSRKGKITDETKTAIIADLKGGASARIVAEKHGVSTASVNNLKKKAGLVKGKKAAPKKVAKKKTAAPKVEADSKVEAETSN